MEGIITSIVIAIGIGLTTYFKKWQGKGEEFDIKKIARTVIVGIAVGVVAQLNGITLTAENYQSYLASNAGAVYVGDQVAHVLWMWFTKLKDVG